MHSRLSHRRPVSGLVGSCGRGQYLGFVLEGGVGREGEGGGDRGGLQTGGTDHEKQMLSLNGARKGRVHSETGSL